VTKKNDSSSNIFIVGSLKQWVLISFIIVIIPLVVAIIDSVIEVGKYTQKSKQTLFQTVNTTENSRIILDRLISMERSIRQFQVLNEPELYDAYKEHRIKFLYMVGSLKTRRLDSGLLAKLKVLTQSENQLYQIITHNLKDNKLTLTESDLNAFDPLTTQARKVLVEGEKKLGQEATDLSKMAKRMQQRLVFSAVASIPLALLLGLIFVYLLTRPISAIGQAIRKLGEVGFDQTIVIKGPKDLTDIGHQLEWLRQRLDSFEYEKQQFIRNVSHELKTPLATLKEGTDLLGENVVGELNAEQQEIVQLMKLGNIALHDLVENLLEYQRAISDQVDLNLSTFDMNILIDRIVNEYKLLLKSKNITLIKNLSTVEIKADYDKLKIIVSNVFSNALKFSPQYSTIGLTLINHDKHVQLTIEDQGPGINKEIQHLIFEEFYQGGLPKEWKIKGSGLGLALVRHYLKIHKGSIILLPASEKFGGARFSLLLPQNVDI
jgi:two-component system sensor histidine kinase GlrK